MEGSVEVGTELPDDDGEGGDNTIRPLLTEVVCEEDKRLIMDVLAVIRVIREPDRLCTTWTVSPMDATGYTLMAYLPRPGQKNHVVEVTHDDISMIESVNIMRVRVGVVQFPSGAAGTWALKIRITSHRCPVTYSTYDALRVNVRRVILTGALSAESGGGGWARTISGMLTGNPNKRAKRPAEDGI